MEGGSFIVEKGQRKDDKEAVHKGWDILKRSSSKLKDLVLDMLPYSKPREPGYEKVKANHVPAEVVELLKEQAAAKGVELIFEPDETLDEVMIDSKAIYRVVLNLVTNAIEACPSPGRRLRGDKCALEGVDNPVHHLESIGNFLTDSEMNRFCPGMNPEFRE